MKLIMILCVLVAGACSAEGRYEEHEVSLRDGGVVTCLYHGGNGSISCDWEGR